MRRALIALTVWLLTVCPAAAAITVANIGTEISASSLNSVTLTTTTNDCPVGSYVMVSLALGNTSAWGINDGLGNTYTPLSQTYTSSQKLVLLYAKVGTDVAIGTVLTISWTTNSRNAAAAICVTGLASSSPLDKTGNGYDSVSTVSAVPGSTLTTGTLSVANEIVVGVWGDGTGTYGTWTEDGSFTSDNFPTPGSNQNVRIAHCISSCTTTSSVAYAPSWVTARVVGAQLWTFKPSGGAVKVCTQMLMGVGPC
jgi:hypothetical protein